MSIIEGLEKILQEDRISFHVPGHKGRDFFPPILKEDVQKIDLTEIPGTDNLHHPQEMILQAQRRAGRIFGAQHSYFLINGTTVGIQGMILATCKPGDKILIPRNCHRSVWSALILGGIEPVYISPETHRETGIGLSISPRVIEDKLREHPEVRGAVLTYPTYYGTCSDIEKIGEILHNENKILLVDEAHGAHLAFHEKLPISALRAGADITVQSTHKILSSFTQTSMLHIGSSHIDKGRIELFLGMLQSSSPSYPLMASLDFAATQAEREGHSRWEEIIYWMEEARHEIHTKTPMKAMGRDLMGKYHIKDFDDGKLCIDVSPLGLKGTEVDTMLRRDYGIQVELSDYYHILAMSGMGTQKKDIHKLVQALMDISDRHKGHRTKLPSIPIEAFGGEMVFPPRQALYAKEEEVALEDSRGRISKEFIIPYPPGIPLILPGERITREALNSIKEIQQWGGQVIGTQDRQLKKIRVVKE